MARIPDIAAGFCISELDGFGEEFVSAALPAPSDDVRVIQYAPGVRVTALLATVPPGVTRIRMALQANPKGGSDCTILDGLAMCTLNSSGPPRNRIVVTAYTATDPEGYEVYRY